MANAGTTRNSAASHRGSAPTGTIRSFFAGVAWGGDGSTGSETSPMTSTAGPVVAAATGTAELAAGEAGGAAPAAGASTPAHSARIASGDTPRALALAS